ncbi:uncharacterized protein BO66DRAFT_456616 [Aspergillus aculeatinus CBS 121060]|uniref:Uncharacterized protein n=1 Tax=Aspergillus aculeatinus CBS 121060 TaxID=1448322 RepID=A0ACD1H2Q5_9EURO|nr:hypothetical protein BO66DRAFT_456616 [Aspergillus aculeatinus CBS 121060]RAH67838.1 hypothetical protein BO66DRAFT_456616 [Aspergillus aculeatinus CBS 121060]
MSTVELVLAVFATVDLCVTRGLFLIEEYKSIKNVSIDYDERVVAIEATWTRVSQQLTLLKSIWYELNEEYRSLQERIIPILARKLENATSNLSKIHQKHNSQKAVIHGAIARSRFVLFVNRSLNEAILDLQNWQGNFDPSWYLITRHIQNQSIDNALAKASSQTVGASPFTTAYRIRVILQEGEIQHIPILPSHEVLPAARRSVIRFTQFQQVNNLTITSLPCILDIFPFIPHVDPEELAPNVQSLASRLQSLDPFEFHVLKCRGVLKADDIQPDKTATPWTFIFDMPGALRNPRSLREHLLFPDVWRSLTDKLRMAKQLAISVSSVHSLGFVHKDIRPETILVFGDGIFPLRELFLGGFEAFRPAGGGSQRYGDLDWARNLYRHPDRQWLYHRADFIMQHDIYSLGICLLEIGLGESFVDYEDTENDDSGAGGGHVSPSSRCLKTKHLYTANRYFISLAQEQLPRHMGDIYARIVVSCLTCTDPENEDFGDERQCRDQNGVLIGVAYIEKVISALNLAVLTSSPP